MRIAYFDCYSGVCGSMIIGALLDAGLEFWWQNKLAFKALALVALGLGVLYLLFSIFIGGGIVAALAAERRVSLRRFLNDAARYFWRYLRLFVLLVIAVGLVGIGHVGAVVAEVADPVTVGVLLAAIGVIRAVV